MDINALEEIAKAATHGPWEVQTDRHPHFRGGAHIERRIRTSWEHGQLKAPYHVVTTSSGIGQGADGSAQHMVAIRKEDAAHIAAANPTAVLEIIALIRRQEAQIIEYEQTLADPTFALSEQVELNTQLNRTIAEMQVRMGFLISEKVAAEQRLAEFTQATMATMSAMQAEAPSKPAAEPIVWIESEPSVRDCHPSEFLNGMCNTVIFHTKKPSTGNPVWPLCLATPQPEPSKQGEVAVTVDTPEFRNHLTRFALGHLAGVSLDDAEGNVLNLIAHIDAHTEQAVAAALEGPQSDLAWYKESLSRHASKMKSLGDELELLRAAPQQHAQAALSDIATLIVRDVCELDYSTYTGTDLMDVTPDDLHVIVEHHIASQQPAAAPGALVDERAVLAWMHQLPVGSFFGDTEHSRTCQVLLTETEAIMERECHGGTITPLCAALAVPAQPAPAAEQVKGDGELPALPDLSDADIVAALHSRGIDTFPSINGFAELQVSATSVPGIRDVVARCIATLATRQTASVADAAAVSDIAVAEYRKGRAAGIEEAAKVCDQYKPISREECPQHWDAYEQAWRIRELTAEQCQTAIRALAAKPAGAQS